MGYRVEVSEDAHRDTLGITDYIAVDLDNIQAADSFLDDVYKVYSNLVDNPRMYALCREPRLAEKGYRQAPIKNYLIFHRVDEAQRIVLIVRVLYAGRDYAKLL